MDILNAIILFISMNLVKCDVAILHAKSRISHGAEITQLTGVIILTQTANIYNNN